MLEICTFLRSLPACLPIFGLVGWLVGDLNSSRVGLSRCVVIFDDDRGLLLLLLLWVHVKMIGKLDC